MRRAAIITMVLAIAIAWVPSVCSTCLAAGRSRAMSCCAGNEGVAVHAPCCKQAASPVFNEVSSYAAPGSADAQATGSFEKGMEVSASDAARKFLTRAPERPRLQRVLRI